MEFKIEGMFKEIFLVFFCYLYIGDFNFGDEFGILNVLEQDFKVFFNCGEYVDVVFVFFGEDLIDIYLL